MQSSRRTFPLLLSVSVPFIDTPPPARCLLTADLCCLPLSEGHNNGVIQCVFSHSWVFSCSTMLLRYIHVVVRINNLLLFIAGKYSFVYMYHKLFIHLPVDRHLDCFQFWLIMNEAVINIYFPLSPRSHTPHSLTFFRTLFQCHLFGKASDYLKWHFPSLSCPLSPVLFLQSS